VQLAMLAPEVLLRGSPDVDGSTYEHDDKCGEAKLLTPKISGELRVFLLVSKADHAKTRRGKGWKAVVTDLDSGVKFAIRAATCGIPTCYCAARVVAVLEKLR